MLSRAIYFPSCFLDMIILRNYFIMLGKHVTFTEFPFRAISHRPWRFWNSPEFQQLYSEWTIDNTMAPFVAKSPTIVVFISYLGMKSWDLHVCDRASTITHVDRVKKSNPWYNKIWLCLNVTIWSSQICLSVIFIHFVIISKYLGKIALIHTFFNHPSLLQLIFGRL